MGQGWLTTVDQVIDRFITEVSSPVRLSPTYKQVVIRKAHGFPPPSRLDLKDKSQDAYSS